MKNGADDSACAPENDKPTVGSILRDRGYEWGASYYSTACVEEEDVDGETAYIDIGDDPDESLQSALDERILEAVNEGLYTTGQKKLLEITTKFRRVFRI